MNDITKILQNKIINIMTSFEVSMKECKEIYNAYWKTDATTKIVALSTGTDPATQETHLTKDEYIGGITYCENLNNFFQNIAVGTTDYRQIIEKIHYGSAATLATPLSVATEALGTRIYNLALDTIEIYKLSTEIIEIYFDNEVGDAIASLDNQRIVYGSEMTKDDLVLAVVMLQEFNKMIDNQAVTQGDYSATISKWKRLETLEQ